MQENEPGSVIQRGFVVWFTGLPSSGKTTLARALHEQLLCAGLKAEHLDGDALRALFPKTGFSPQERNEHIIRTGFLAQRLEFHGVAVVASLVSPYAASRAKVREMCRTFIEVHVCTPLEVCEGRDVKGLYRRARNGEIAGFTGVSDVYEPPLEPELRLDTAKHSERECLEKILSYLRSNSLFLADAQHPGGGRWS